MEEERRIVVEENIYNILKKCCKGQLLEILKSSDILRSQSFEISFLRVLYDEYPEVGSLLLQHPTQVLPILDAVGKRILLEIRTESTPVLAIEDCSKINLRARVHSLPTLPNITFHVFPDSRAIGSFLCLMGTVVRVSDCKMLEHSKVYRCSVCTQTFDVSSIASRGHAFPKAPECPEGCQGPASVVHQKGDYSNVRNYQEIKLQEFVHKMDFGNAPKVLVVVLEDDLVDVCKPGDDVTVTGYLYLRHKPFRQGTRIECELVFQANYIRVNNDQKNFLDLSESTTEKYITFWGQFKNDPFAGRKIIVSSFCPQVHGMYIVKLAMCVVLAGGVPRTTQGMDTRGESHILLVGDPATAKSQLLKYTSRLCPRSVMTNGVGTSSAGLTVSAVREDGAWHLEAGALVLADGGVCCIDEFGCMKPQDQASIHEAMEQQSISVAKAGIVTKLTTNVTIVAATNPKGKYDSNNPGSMDLGIPSPLLSRFDLVLMLLDDQDDAWDKLMADFILGARSFSKEQIWDVDVIQRYLVKIKDLMPVVSEDAWAVVRGYYEYQRGQENRDPGRTTLRLLESLRRLSEGHARLMFREEVLVCDAITAIMLMEFSVHSSTILKGTSCLRSVPPLNPMNDYMREAQQILEKLGLDGLWEKEKLSNNL